MSLSQAHIAPWTLLLTLATCTPAPVHAQATSLAEAPIRFERIDGLSHNTVLSIVQDRQGFLWIGTVDGLNRYDGYDFVVYRHDPTDSTSLSDNSVGGLREDRQGQLWIRTAAGLDRFDPQTEQFVRYGFLSPVSEQSGFPPPLEDHQGQLWVGTGDRLYRYDRQSDAFRPGLDPPNNATRDTLWNAYFSTDPFWGMYEDRAGTFWLSTKPGNLYKMDPASHQLHRFVSPWTNMMVWYEDDQGRLWIMHAKGMGAFDPTTHAFTPLSVVPEGQGVSMLQKDRTGIFWAGTGEGLYRYNPVTDERRHVPIDPSPGAHLQNAVRALHEDRTGALWVGTLSGLYRLDPHTKPFAHLRHDPTNPNSLSSNTVMAVWEDTDGLLWVGTFGGGLNRVDQDAGTVTRYWHKPGDPSSLCNDLIWSLYEDRRGLLWMGTDQGLCSLNRRTNRFTRYDLPLPSTWPYSFQPAINALREDQRGRLWIATIVGLYRLDPHTGAVTPYPQFAHDQRINANFVQSLHVDQAGFLWLGTYTGDLYRLDTDTEVFTRYRVLAQEALTSGEGIWAIHEDTTGVLWLGSDRGLTRFDPQTEAVKHYMQRDGLPGSIVYALLEDDAHRLWLSTNHGLARFDAHLPDEQPFRNYDAGDGLQNTEFNRRAAFKSRRGTFFFGGLEGLTSFVPAQIQDNPYVPPVVLTRIQTSNRDTTVTINPFGLDRLVLSYREYTFSFAFAALNYTNPLQNQYAYQLEGFDNAWMDADTRRSVQYTNIPPGDYTFRVKASNNDGLWNEEGVALRLTITPPFWQTWWFRLLVVAFVVGVLTVAYRYRVARLLEMERMRLRIASDLHDDIGSKLSSIALMSEMVGKHAHLAPREAQRLAKVSDVAREMVGALRDIVWLVSPDHDRTDDLIERMRDVSGQMLDGLACTFASTANGLPEALPMALRRNIFLIYREALHNIARHAQASEVTIRLNVHKSRLVLTITDNGVGFDATAAHHGHGLKNMRTRAGQIDGDLEITSDPGRGTTLTLTVPVK